MNYIKCFSEISGHPVPQTVALILCETVEEYKSQINKWGHGCAISGNLITKSLSAEGTYIYSLSNDGATNKGAAIINMQKIGSDYELDKIVFHELGHSISVGKFAYLPIRDHDSYNLVIAIFKEACACYYSYLCLKKVYGGYDKDTEYQEVIKDLNFFTEIIINQLPELSPTDIGNISGQILVNCRPLIETIDEKGRQSFWNKTKNPQLSQKLYDIICENSVILNTDVISSDLISNFVIDWKKLAQIVKNQTLI